MKKIIFISLLIIMPSSFAGYQTKQLFLLCKEKNYFSYNTCMAYIAGYLDAISASYAMQMKNISSSNYKYDFNSQYIFKNYDDIAALYVAWVRDQRNLLKNNMDKENFLEKDAFITFGDFMLVKNAIPINQNLSKVSDSSLKKESGIKHLSLWQCVKNSFNS